MRLNTQIMMEQLFALPISLRMSRLLEGCGSYRTDRIVHHHVTSRYDDSRTVENVYHSLSCLQHIATAIYLLNFFLISLQCTCYVG